MLYYSLSCVAFGTGGSLIRSTCQFHNPQLPVPLISFCGSLGCMLNRNLSLICFPSVEPKTCGLVYALDYLILPSLPQLELLPAPEKDVSGGVLFTFVKQQTNDGGVEFFGVAGGN